MIQHQFLLFDFLIRDLLVYLCQKDSFWQKNICSPGKLRKQYDRLTDHFAADLERILRKKREKEAAKWQREQREKEYKDLEEMEPVPQEKIHKMVQSALKPKHTGSSDG